MIFLTSLEPVPDHDLEVSPEDADPTDFNRGPELTPFPEVSNSF